MLAALEAGNGVSGVHGRQVWTLTSGMDVATAHLVTEAGDPEQVLAAARGVLHGEFAIAHATLQVETTRA